MLNHTSYAALYVPEMEPALLLQLVWTLVIVLTSFGRLLPSVERL